MFPRPARALGTELRAGTKLDVRVACHGALAGGSGEATREHRGPGPQTVCQRGHRHAARPRGRCPRRGGRKRPVRECAYQEVLPC